MEKQTTNELRAILKTMDVPKDRKDDLIWLLRNLRIKNSNHPRFHLAMIVIRELLGIS